MGHYFPYRNFYPIVCRPTNYGQDGRACAPPAPPLRYARDWGRFALILFSRRPDFSLRSKPGLLPDGPFLSGGLRTPPLSQQPGDHPTRGFSSGATTLPSPEAWRSCAKKTLPRFALGRLFFLQPPSARRRKIGQPRSGHSRCSDPTAPPLGDDPPVGCPRLRVGSRDQDRFASGRHLASGGPALSSPGDWAVQEKNKRTGKTLPPIRDTP
jgi:hypothetical protein